MVKENKSTATYYPHSFVDILFGRRTEYSLEHRFFNSVCLFSALAAFFATITNIALQLNSILTAFTFISSIIFISFYYFSRKRKIYKPLLTHFIIYSLLGLSTVWFFNSGSQGPVIFVYLIALVFFVIITEGRNRIIVISGFISNLILLFITEMKFPSLVTHYESETVKFYDVSITFLFSFIIIYFVVAILVRSYRDEKIISTKQRDEIADQKKQMTDSIQYASSLQKALLPNQNYIKKLLPEHFIFFKPKDIVSGDFYWFRNINDYIIIVIADCTGHGVPGALMSVLGISLINEITNKKEVRKANQALEVLRHEIKDQLNHSSSDYSINSGMDIAICVIEPDKKIMQYAGANNPLYLFRDNKLIEYKPTRNPIGSTPIEIPFQNHEIELQEGDTFYLFTDGFIDQFGGEQGKKFRSRRFRHMLLGMNNKPMNDQKKLLENNLKYWLQNKYEQVDDMLILGFRVK
ncbi:MAG: hypothetical protein A2X13_13770 [Bacteroidetes bacterium GWC2_33_15]|nr:MAG: hypothetical protein A2X10_08985 [Bacteroidetes bacterium GWA2_33_15]OFX50414.1 MAG: hypothetical protein A2X13_13770 [Bacteroidetes bacterium GWC2_33_15]OFX66668.1 MAG: hypothetical protein A2X15_08105 [Bacteroidetes bacterium GWB2_32_14]OFX69286.1 MAG: hypothetical protein A2X14_09035 [Bacteroidetes bacterium GWD2_33_33]HAN18601.1 hypothetical protein [Bacteroidales bacterium]